MSRLRKHNAAQLPPREHIRPSSLYAPSYFKSRSLSRRALTSIERRSVRLRLSLSPAPPLDRVSNCARAHRTVIWGSVTQNEADVRLFIRAATAAASVGAGGDGKFAYTMKQSLSAVDERKVARWQNFIAPPRPPPWRNPRKGRDQILQRSGAIVQKPEGPNTYHLKIYRHLATVDERRRVERTIEAKAVDALLNNAAAKLFDRGRGDPSVEQLLLCSFVWGLRLHVRRPYDTMMVRSFNAKDRGGLNVIYGSVKPPLLASCDSVGVGVVSAPPGQNAPWFAN